MNETTPIFQPRPTCYKCFRPEALCYCDVIVEVANRTRVIVVQHPREEFHPLNTARIAERSLKNSTLIRSNLTSIGRALVDANVSQSAAILYPTNDAEELETMSPENFPREVIVLDGTWHHAKTLLRDVPELQNFRRIRFNPARPSEYRIRKEPQLDYLSTVESIAYVLGMIEPSTSGIDRLLSTFREMIDRNLAARRPADNQTRFRSRAAERPHRFPATLAVEETRFVVAYCEGTSRFARNSDSPQANNENEKEPLVVVALRPSTGEKLSLLLKTQRRAPDRLLGHLALSREQLMRERVGKDEARQRISSFLSPNDVVVVWNSSSRSILQELGVKLPAHLGLKGAYCDWMLYQEKMKEKEPRSWGSMTEVIQRHAISHNPSAGSGRAGRRLDQAAAILGWLRQQREEHCSE